MRVLAPLLLAAVAAQAAGSAAVAPAGRETAYRVPAKLPDAAEPLKPWEVRLTGFLGTRVANNEKNRLLQVDEDRILAGFRSRPGEQAWIGEHVGKWLHAASIAWVNTGDAALREKLDRVVRELLKTQEPDGYLGTYVPSQRFGLYPNADWDVWVHKYNLIGLLTYHRYTGSEVALDASRKMGDLLLRTFGPGKKSILAAGTHVGMASTSVLEPMVLLYRATGDGKYLDFCRYLVQAWDEEKGPRVMSTLLTEKSVAKTGNAKAYEMLSNLVGLCELARVTGDRSYLQPALNAWQDVTANQLYVTGSASHHEHFHAPHELPNGMGANVGETCVTVTWIQLNAQLLRLTGEAKYADELERSYYNHLAGAQRPDGAQWCYYTSLEGTKPYGPGINCCVSSGPRGMAMAPELTYSRYREAGKDGLSVNFFEAGEVTTQLGGGQVTLRQVTRFPEPLFTGDSKNGSALVLLMDRPREFGLRVRSPQWAGPLALDVPGMKARVAGPKGGWAVVPPRKWKNGDRVDVHFQAPIRLLQGEHGNAGYGALTYGPLVLAYDEKRNRKLPAPRLVALTPNSAKAETTLEPGQPVVVQAEVRTRTGEKSKALFVPFAQAGIDGGRYSVWLRGSGTPFPQDDSLFGLADESRSADGNVQGSIADGDLTSFVVTFNASPQREAWFALRLAEPVSVRRVVYAHGRTFHDGGWFDAGAGKPRVQVQREKDGAWETVGTLEDYPATTATDSKGIRPGQEFTLRTTEPLRIYGIRVIGKPAHGDNPAQAFASCAELRALGQ